MVITVTVQLLGDDQLAYAPDAAAAQVLAALGANPTKDSCNVTVNGPTFGSAGTPPPDPNAVATA
jgi:hypothetical protein